MSDLPGLHRGFNITAETQAVFPSAVLLNIFNVLSLVDEVVAIILAFVVLVVLLYLFVSMYSATLERKREIATMRALGARRATILGIVLLDSCALAVIGGALGIAGGHGVVYLGVSMVAGSGGAVANFFVVRSVGPVIFSVVLVLGGIGGML